MPSDRGNGLAMRTGLLLDAYAKRFDIDLVVVPVAGGTESLTSFVAERVRRATVLRPAKPDTHFTLINSLADADARLAAFRQYARPSIAARLGPEVERALLAFAQDHPYSMVHVSRLYLAALTAAWKALGSDQPPRLVLDCDEDDVSAYRRFAQLHRRWGRDRRADWADAEAEAFGTLARVWLPRFDLLLAASSSEARILSTRGQGVAVTVLPNVAASARSRRKSLREGRHDVLFVGNMSYLPNIDAALWFATRIWPKLRSMVPFPIRFVIAGNGPPPEVVALARRPGIVVLGGFDDVAPLYRRAALAVVPIRAGGGTRIKLFESANHGVPVVATRFGASGTGFRSGHELLLAENEREFAASCAKVLTRGNLASQLATRALTRVRRDYNAKRLATRLLSTINAMELGDGRNTDQSRGPRRQ
jgi:glycosyltransferase involved in cell wall biosynthesis